MSTLHRTVLESARTTFQVLVDDPQTQDVATTIDDALFACALERVDETVSAEPLVVRAIDAVRGRRVHPALFGGLAGLGFVLSAYGYETPLLDAIDDAIHATIPKLPVASLQGGVAGVAVYGCMRSHEESGRRLQIAALEALTAAKVPSRGGTLWPTSPAYARARGLQADDSRILELGMVHGVGGAIVALASLAMKGHARAAELARSALHAVWAWERTPANRFGRIELGEDGEGGEIEVDPRRWCAGDPGVLRASWLAANAVDDVGLAERALGALRTSAAADLAGGMPGAPGHVNLCCGAAAIAQIYIRMHRETGEPVFRSAQERIVAATAPHLGSLPVRGLLYGRQGVLLAALASLTGDEATWDGLLGMSLPHRAHRASDARDTPQGCDARA